VIAGIHCSIGRSCEFSAVWEPRLGTDVYKICRFGPDNDALASSTRDCTSSGLLYVVGQAIQYEEMFPSNGVSMYIGSNFTQ
jgi:hypothetical protein